METATYISRLNESFQQKSDEEIAFSMAKYMKGKFPFFGIKGPVRKEITKAFVSKNGLPLKDHFDEFIHGIWEIPHRELHYTGMEIAEKYKKQFIAKDIYWMEFMIVNQSWWDTVDFIATHLVGNLFKMFPDLIPEWNNRWISSENMWLRRTAILFQLKYKEKTDKDLLYSNIIECSGEKEFFIRKAIGWSLRELSKTYPEEVRRFVDKNKISGLSRREALKRISV